MIIDWAWVRDQLHRAGYTTETANGQAIATSVERLLRTWEDMNHSPETSDPTLTAFAGLARGHAIAPDAPDETWVQAYPGEYKVGDTVRVKPDAYDGHLAVTHNGKRGRVVGARNSQAVVIYADDPDKLPRHHSPENLERLA